MRRRNGRRAIGNLLIGLGVVLLVAVGGTFGWTEYRGRQLRAELRLTPPPVAAATAVAAVDETATPASPTKEVVPSLTPTPTITPLATTPVSTPTATRPPATSTPSPTPIRTATPVPAPAGQPARIVIPALKIDAKVVEMGWRSVDTASGPQSEWVIPQNEAGHHINSASLGERGNLVISGHNNIYGRVFEAISLAWDDDRKQTVDAYTDQSSVLNGRTIELYNAAGQRFVYTITAFYRLKDTGVSLAQRIENARFTEPTADAQLTLITCWPITSNTHRLIVVAVPAG